MRAKRFRFWCGRDIVVASATLAVHCGCVTGRALWVRTVTASNCSHASYMTRVTYVTHFTHFTHVTQLLMLPKNIKMKGPLSTWVTDVQIEPLLPVSECELTRMQVTMMHLIWQFAFLYGVTTISGLVKINVSSAEYRLLYRALLQKRPIIWRSLLIEATPYANASCASHLARECVQNASNASHLLFLQNILELGLSPEIPPLKSTDIWKSRIQTRTFSALIFHLQFSVLSTPRYCLSFVTVIHVNGSLNESRHPCHAGHTCHTCYTCHTCKRKMCIAVVIRVNESRHTYPNESRHPCHTCHTWHKCKCVSGFITTIKQTKHTNKHASYASHLSYMWMSHATHIRGGKPCHGYSSYGVATISRLLKFIGLFRRISSLL